MLWTAPLPHPNFHGYFLGVFQKPHSSPHCQETAARPSSAGRGLQSDVRFALKATELLRGREMTRCANTGLMQRSKIARRYSITLSGRTHPQRDERS